MKIKIKFTMLMLIIFLCHTMDSSLANDNIINENPNIQLDNSEVQILIKNYLQTPKRCIEKLSGENVTFKFDNKIKNLYESNRLTEIVELLVKNNLILSWFEENSSPFSTTIAKNSSRIIPTIKTSTNYPDITKEWAVKISGTFYFDRNTKKVVSVGKPICSLFTSVNFGSTFKPYITNVTTKSYKLNDYSVNYSASYTMVAEFLYNSYSPAIFPRVTASYNDGL